MNELPIPRFNPKNPYWVDPAMFFAWIRPEYRPRLTGQDFAYAWMWEVNSPHRTELPPLVAFLRSYVWKALWMSNLRLKLKEQVNG